MLTGRLGLEDGRLFGEWVDSFTFFGGRFVNNLLSRAEPRRFRSLKRGSIVYEIDHKEVEMVKQRLSREEWIDYLRPLARRVKQRKSNNQPTAKNVAKLTRGTYSAQDVRMALVHNKIDHKEVGMVRKVKENTAAERNGSNI